MSNGDEDRGMDEAAEPFMEQAKDALGDATGDEDRETPANPSLLQGDRQDSQPENKRPDEDSD